MARVLFVLTSQDTIGNTDEQTGFYFGEAAQPWDALVCAGHTVVFASPLGGTAPRTRIKPDDPVDRTMLLDAEAMYAIDNTIALASVNPADYDALHLPGGHGTMWDFASDSHLARIAVAIYERGKPISAICHGVAGLVNSKLSDGSYLVSGRRLTSFTNEEERAVGKDGAVPYLLESVLRERGAEYVQTTPFEPNVVQDGNLLTGQNPVSSRLLANALVSALHGSSASSG